MIVHLQAGQAPWVSERDDMKSLKAVANGGVAPLIPEGWLLDGDHLWIDIAWLAAQGGDAPEWRDGFARMIAFAETRGWVSAGRVRAHLE